MMYAIKRGRRTVAHLATGEFRPPLCGRSADLTSNAPGGKTVCRDCQRIAQAYIRVPVRKPRGLESQT